MASSIKPVRWVASAVLPAILSACQPELPNTMFDRPILRARIEIEPSTEPGCSAHAVAVNETPEHWVRVHHDMRQTVEGGTQCRVTDRIVRGQVDVGRGENSREFLGCAVEVRADGCTVTRQWQINTLTFTPLLSEADAIG